MRRRRGGLRQDGVELGIPGSQARARAGRIADSGPPRYTRFSAICSRYPHKIVPMMENAGVACPFNPTDRGYAHAVCETDRGTCGSGPVGGGEHCRIAPGAGRAPLPVRRPAAGGARHDRRTALRGGGRAGGRTARTDRHEPRRRPEGRRRRRPARRPAGQRRAARQGRRRRVARRARQRPVEGGGPATTCCMAGAATTCSAAASATTSCTAAGAATASPSRSGPGATRSSPTSGPATRSRSARTRRAAPGPRPPTSWPARRFGTAVTPTPCVPA